MDIATVKKNLENTIAGKEQYLQVIELDRNNRVHAGSRAAQEALIQILTINIDELKRILADVNQCVTPPTWTPHNCPYAAAETCHRVG